MMLTYKSELLFLIKVPRTNLRCIIQSGEDDSFRLWLTVLIISLNLCEIFNIYFSLLFLLLSGNSAEFMTTFQGALLSLTSHHAYIKKLFNSAFCKIS